MRDSIIRFFRSDILLFLMFAGITTGAYFEATACSFSMAICAGSIIALASSTDRRLRNSILAASFGSLFLFIIGASILASHCRTDAIRHLRPGLLQTDPAIVAGAGLLFVYFVMRMAVIPFLSVSNDIRGWIIGIGPGWISALILGIRISGSLPHHVIESLSIFMKSTAILSLFCIGVAVLRNQSKSRWIHLTASGIGILIVYITWHGSFYYHDILDLIIRTSVVSLAVYIITPIARYAFSTGSLLLTLGLAGFPMSILYDLRRTLYLTVDSVGVNIGFIIMWLVPLVALLRGLQWQGRRTESRLARFTIGPLALCIGIIALFFAFPDIYSVWLSL